MLWLRSHIVRATDIKKVADWYTQVFEKKPYFQNENYIWFEVAGFEFGVFGIFPGEDVPIWKNIMVYWWVEDIDSEYTRIKDLWAKPLSDIVDVGWGILMGDFEDPFGNFFGIIHNPNFKE
jgi:lactoylglutathione lyase